MLSEKVEFIGSQGGKLAARLDLPESSPRAYALFAHCFTCTKDIHAASNICTELTRHGIAVLRFDFSGLGLSEGDFANTNFSTNLEDLQAACAWLAEHHQPAKLLIGHSLGGAAVLAAAGNMPDVKAVATIAAPAEPSHVAHHFTDTLEEIQQNGEAMVKLAGRAFRIKKQFLDDIESHSLQEKIGKLNRALIIFHSPTDETVGIENAGKIFAAAKHPKSFISLSGADHLLRGSENAQYVAQVLSAWLSRYL
jgi:putative redox protein